jgi:hypothetical protein
MAAREKTLNHARQQHRTEVAAVTAKDIEIVASLVNWVK